MDRGRRGARRRFRPPSTTTSSPAPVTWSALGLAIALDFLGEFRVVDGAVLQRISPFAATSVPLTTGSGLAAALVVLAVTVGVLVGVGLLGLRRRDLDAS